MCHLSWYPLFPTCLPVSLGEQVILGKCSEILNGGIVIGIALLPCISSVHRDFQGSHTFAFPPLSPNLVLTHRAVFNSSLTHLLGLSFSTCK